MKDISYKDLMNSINDNTYYERELSSYISQILKSDYNPLFIKQELDFFKSQFASCIINNSTLDIMPVINYLEIILAYRNDDKKVTYSVIVETTLMGNHAKYLINILSIDKNINSIEFENINVKLERISRYNLLIKWMTIKDDLIDEDIINKTEELIEDCIFELNTKRKSVNRYKRDREDLINESILEIQDIINRTNKETDSKKEQQHIIKSDIEEHDFYKTEFTHQQLVEIFRKSMEKELFRDDTRLMDFLYVFGGENKPNDFNKLHWIITTKSKFINKKLLIHFFMKIYGIKRENVLKPFLFFMNSRVQTKEKPLNLNNKPDSYYNPTELEGFFPEK